MVSGYETFRHIFTAHAQELPIKNRTQLFAPATSISYKSGIFPLSDDVFGIYLMFCAEYSFDLVTLILDLLTLASSEE